MELIYKAVDGQEFRSKTDCVAYEMLISKVNEIMSALPPPPPNKDYSISNKVGFVQHDKKTALSVRRKLLELASQYISHPWMQVVIEDENANPHRVANFFVDYNLRPLASAWRRFQCMSPDFKEWRQTRYRTS